MHPQRLVTFCIAFLAILHASSAAMDEKQPSTPAPSDLEGSYYGYSNGYVGESITILPGGQFKQETYSCTTHDCYSGVIRTTSTALLFIAQNAQFRQDAFHDLRSEEPLPSPWVLVPVRWSDRTYLIESDRIADFCNAINRGAEPRSQPSGGFYLRSPDWQKPASGLPNLAPDQRKLIRSRPLRATVDKLLGSSTALLSVGADQGIAPGLEFYPEHETSLPFSVRVQHVHVRTCTVIWNGDIAELKLGQVFTTRLPARRNAPAERGAPVERVQPVKPISQPGPSESRPLPTITRWN